MSSSPRRRWFRYGEPWGLFEKLNPKATPWTVLRKALIGGIGASFLFGVLMWFGRNANPVEMKVWMVVFAVISSFVYGLFEWQYSDDELPEDSPRE